MASMDLYSYCNGDPVNGYDPDGRFGKAGSDAYNNGYGVGPAAMMGASYALQQFGANSGNGNVAFATTFASSLLADEANISSPQVTLPAAYQQNIKTFGNSYTALNATINPAYTLFAQGYEAYTGYGLSGGNLGQQLSTVDRLSSGLGAIGTVSGFAAWGAGGLEASAAKTTGDLGSVIPKGYSGGPGAMWTGEGRNLWNLTREGAAQVMSHPTFGILYKSSSDGLWWAVDNAGHGGSAFKVFQETGSGLQWFRDADQFGDFIVGKYKGPTGQFIPWKQLNAK